jgi:outer membrane immunogenic protein
MKRFTLAVSACLLAIAVAAPAFAADLSRPAFKAPAFAAPFNWTGFYVGINGGYAWGTSNWTGAGDFNATGEMVGGTVGYNLQMSQFVAGFEGDFDGSWLKGSATSACCEIKNDWFGTARARLGIAMDRWLPFVTGGAAFGDVKLDTALGSDTDTRIGWTAGAGIEYAFTGAWSAKVEYLYVDLGTPSCSVATCGVATDVAFKANIVRGGVNYHF